MTMTQEGSIRTQGVASVINQKHSLTEPTFEQASAAAPACQSNSWLSLLVI